MPAEISVSFRICRNSEREVNPVYRRILVPIDGSDTANRGLAEAIKLAKDQKAALRLLHVVDQAALVRYPEATLYGADLPKALEQQGQEILAQAEAVVRKQGLKVDTVFHRKLARVADVIIQQAKKWPADIIVLGTHGRRGVDRLVMGSDAELVVRTSPVPVLLIRPKTPPRRVERGRPSRPPRRKRSAARGLRG